MVFLHKAHLTFHTQRHIYCVVHVDKSVVYLLKSSFLTSSLVLKWLLVTDSNITEVNALVFKMQLFY